MKKNKIFSMGLALAIGAGAALTSCVDTDSNLVDFGSDLHSPNDTVYSLLGIMNKMQAVADRTIILGELKGETTTVTEAATTDLKAIANFTATAKNRYNTPEDYYAIIQNCNYYIAHADTNLSLRGEKVFIREYAAVKAFRAWTYLQLAIHYGKVPFFTRPLMTEAETDPSLHPKYGVKEICDYFISDLAPYLETDYPLGNSSYNTYFIPVRVLLGDLCLWAGRYREAAQYYHDYLTHPDQPLPPTGIYSVSWTGDNDEFIGQSMSVSSPLCTIRMEDEEFDGIVSYLDDVFESTTDNRYYFQATGSGAMIELSQAQQYVKLYTNTSTGRPDTLYAPRRTDAYQNSVQMGDLRYSGKVTSTYTTGVDGYSEDYQSVSVISTSYVPLYQTSSIYLRMAEAYNRAGLYESAFAILKYGLSTSTVEKYINADERNRAGNLLSWSQYYFITQDMTTDELMVTTAGIHSYGSGATHADTLYAIPDDLGSSKDSMLYVEDLICDEMALEQGFEGQRFADLQRIALHRDDTEFFARKVAGRGGKDHFDQALYERLLNRDNWYLPLE